MADEIISEPTLQTPAEPQTAPQLEPTQVQPENPISEPNPVPVSPQEPTEQAPIPPTESTPAPVPPEPVETSPNPEDAIPVKDDISANEPFNQPTETAQTVQEPQQTESNPEQNSAPESPKTSPETVTRQPTAQLPPNEPFDKTPDSAKATLGEQDRPIDLAEEIKTKNREENLKLANETRLEKKRMKIDAILDLFAKQTNLTNDEVEKLLHVSDATATRYLETLEKEGKIKQVGKTGKGVSYTKI